MADVCTKIISGNNIKTNNIYVIKTGGGKGFKAGSGTIDNNLATNMDTKYDAAFDRTDFHVHTHA